MHAVVAFGKPEFDLMAHIVTCRTVKHNKLVSRFVVHYCGIKHATLFPGVVRVGFQYWVTAVFCKFHI